MEKTTERIFLVDGHLLITQHAEGKLQRRRSADGRTAYRLIHHGQILETWKAKQPCN